MRRLSDGERAILAQDGPADEGEAFLVLDERRIRAARKVHECNLCSDGHVSPGEPYHRIVALAEGRFEITRYCCAGLCKRAKRDGG